MNSKTSGRPQKTTVVNDSFPGEKESTFTTVGQGCV